MTIETEVETIRIRKFWAPEQVMLAWLDVLDANPTHEAISFAAFEDSMRLIDDNELDLHPDPEVASWFTELIENEEWFSNIDRVEIILDEVSRAERRIGGFLGGDVVA